MRIFREPLLHFLILGILIFVAHALTRDIPLSTIVVEAARQDAFRQELFHALDRWPTDDEINAQIESYVEREVLFRSAKQLGLDRDDPVIRQRLIQKMRYYLDAEPAQTVISDEELRAYFQTHRDRYTKPARFSFTHVYLGAAEPNHENLKAYEQIKKSLEQGEDPQSVGKPFPLGQRFVDIGGPKLAQTLGDGFASSLAALEPGRWHGPVESRYGFHLVWLDHQEPARRATLDEVRGPVRRDLGATRVRQQEQAALRTLRRDFTVVIENSAGPAYTKHVAQRDVE